MPLYSGRKRSGMRSRRKRKKRGHDRPQATMLTLVNPEQRVPADHPIRLIKPLAEVALEELSPRFEQMYSEVGRPSIPPERLLKASLLSSTRCAASGSCASSWTATCCSAGSWI
jgi:hypothetical protein